MPEDISEDDVIALAKRLGIDSSDSAPLFETLLSHFFTKWKDLMPILKDSYSMTEGMKRLSKFLFSLSVKN